MLVELDQKLSLLKISKRPSCSVSIAYAAVSHPRFIETIAHPPAMKFRPGTVGYEEPWGREIWGRSGLKVDAAISSKPPVLGKGVAKVRQEGMKSGPSESQQR